MLRRTAIFFIIAIALISAVRLNTAPAAITPLQFVLLAISLAIVFIRPVASPMMQFLDRLRHPAPARRETITLIIGVLSTAYLILTAFLQHRELYPRFHDDQVYLLQMRFLSTGHLWTAPHALPDFFDTFYVLVTPVCAPIYFPGTAMLYVWEIWLHTPIWLGPAMASGAIIALMFRIATEILDDAVLGFLAALCVLGVTWIRYLSMVLMSHTALILLGLILIFAFLKWKQRPTLARAAIFGIILGWIAVTRPLDALCYAVPVSLAMLIHIRGLPRSALFPTIATVVLSAAPFLALQLAFDKNTTGHFLKTPYTWYSEIYDPSLAYGAHTYDPTLMPKTVVLQKKFYDRYYVGSTIEAAANNSPIASWTQWKFQKLMSYGLPRGPMVGFVVAGLLAFRRPGAWILWGIAPMLLVVYSFFAFLLPQYCVLSSPPLAILVVMGIDALRKEFNGIGRQIDLFLTLAVIVLSVFTLNEFSGERDDITTTPTMRTVAIDMPQVVHAPAVVLFHFDPRDDYSQEPVYNYDTLNIDDAPIIRAHDLGPQRNREIFDYYAKRQPDRMFYLFDRHASQITPMATTRQLAEQFPLSAPASDPASSPQ